MKRNQRASGRLDFEGIPCDLGRLVNVSSGGMVVEGPPSSDDLIEACLGEGPERLVLKVRRVWVKPLRRALCRTGYRFVDPPPDLLVRLLGVRLPQSRARVL